MTVRIDFDRLPPGAVVLNGNGRIAQSPSPRLLTLRELMELPDPEWLVDALLVKGTEAMLAGAPGEYKSFLALDLSLCIATGRDWCGKPVKQGTVVYVVGEGLGGMKARAYAWCLAHHVEIDDPAIRFLPYAVDLRDRGAVDAFSQAIAQLEQPPVLLVIDTLARSMPGTEENSNREMGEAIVAGNQLRGGGTVLYVHHTKRGGSDGAGRGASALDAAVETRLWIRKHGKQGESKLSIEKQKNGVEGKFWHFRFDPIKLTTSGVLRQFDPAHTGGDGPPLGERILELLRMDPGRSTNAIERRVDGGTEKIREALRVLIQDGLVRVDQSGVGHRHYVVEASPLDLA